MLLVASVWCFPEGYLFSSTPRTAKGFRVKAPPYIWVPIDASVNEIAEKLLLVLDASRDTVDYPNEGWRPRDEGILITSPFKTWATFDKKAKIVSVTLENGLLVFTPSKRVKGGYAYLEGSGKADLGEDKEIFAKLLKQAAEKCI